MARVVAIVLIVVGLIGVFDIAGELVRGKAEVSSPGRGTSVQSASKAEQPQEFYRLIQYQALRCVLYLAAGWVILRIDRRWDSLDPFSTSYKGSTDVK